MRELLIVVYNNSPEGISSLELEQILGRTAGQLNYCARSINKYIVPLGWYLGNDRARYIPGYETRPLFKWYLFAVPKGFKGTYTDPKRGITYER